MNAVNIEMKLWKGRRIIMINEQENKNSLKGMSDLEYQKNDTEMMRYRVNGLSNKIGLCGMAFSLLGAFICLNSMMTASFQVILIILLNIVILLGGFLAAEKVKNYSKQGAIAQMVFGGICFARIFYIPLMLIIKYSEYCIAKENNDTNTIKVLKEKYLGPTITSVDEGFTANAFLPSSGYFRGISAMVLFACAGVCFIIAGIIGYKRAKKLNTYLESIKEKN